MTFQIPHPSHENVRSDPREPTRALPLPKTYPQHRGPPVPAAPSAKEESPWAGSRRENPGVSDQSLLDTKQAWPLLSPMRKPFLRSTWPGHVASRPKPCLQPSRYPHLYASPSAGSKTTRAGKEHASVNRGDGAPRGRNASA